MTSATEWIINSKGNTTRRAISQHAKLSHQFYYGRVWE